MADMQERLPPQDLEAEQATLGAICAVRDGDEWMVAHR